MANKKINELIEKAVVNANDLVFIGDPVTGWLYNTTIADLQVGSITGGLAGSGQAGYVPRFKTAQTLENSLLFNGASGIGIGTTSGSHYLSLNGDYARTIGLERSTLLDASGVLGLTISAGGSASGMLNSSGGDLILKSGISTGDGLSSIRLFTSTSGVSGIQDNALIEQVTVLGNGNVGFGVINPTYKVEVDGNIGNGEYGIDTSFITFNNAPISVPTTPGTLRWNDTDGTLEFTMKGGNVTQQIGQELPILVKHADNSGLIEGKVVYSVGTDGGNLTVRYANSNMETTSSTTFGVMTESATGGAKAFCTTFGLVRNFDTSSLVEGQAIWLDSVDGGMTTTKPVQPKHLVYIGVCLRSHATNGVIFVNVTNGQELEELHDVLITNRQNNQTLIYDSATSLWKNRTIIGANGYIPYWDSTDLFKQSPILVSASGTTVTMNGMNLLLNDSGTLNYLTKFGSTKTVINSLIYDSGTKVGIGTTNPEFLFTVVGGAMGVYSSSTNYGFIDTANTSMRLVSANGFNFTANNIGTIANTRVDANGNWGFGIGTPTYKVDVNGDVNTNGIYRINGSPLSTSNIAEGTNLYFTSNRVLGQVLTGLNTSLTGVVTAADSLIVGISKLQNQVSSIVSGVSSVFGRTGAVVAQSGDYNTSQVTESTNLYYTDARARSAISGGIGISYNNTTGLIAFSGTLYTDASIRALFSAGSGISYNNTTGVIASTITQYTDAMARASISLTTTGTSGAATYNSTTGVLNIPQYQTALTNPITGTGTTNYLPKFTGSTTIGNSLIYDNGTTIALGNTANGIGYALELNTNVSTPRIDLVDNGTYTGFLKTNGLLVSVGNNSANAFTINTGGSERMRITSTGNVIIGSTSLVGHKFLVMNASSQQIGFHYDTNNFGSIGARSNGDIQIYAYTAGVGYKNILLGVDGNSIGGNVGIGTTSPSYLLDVNGTGRFTNTLSIASNSNAGTIEFGTGVYRGILDYTANTGIWKFNNQSAASASTIYYQLQADGTSILNLTKGGNLGLGVIPSAWSGFTAFDIGTTGNLASYGSGSDVQLNANAYYNGLNWIYKTTNSSGRFRINGNQFEWINAPSGTAGTTISFTQAMTLDASGNLLVGATSSSDGEKVKIYRSSGSSDFATNTTLFLNSGAEGTTANLIRFNGAIAKGLVFGRAINADSFIWGFTNSTTPVMTLDASGRLGVGLTNPSTRLDIQETASNTYGTINIRGNNRGGGIDMYSNTTWLAQMYADTSSNVVFATGSGFTERLRINGSSGNVSIGNTNNTYKLDVSGTGRFDGNVQLTSDNFIYGNSTIGSGTIRAGIRFNSTSQELKFFTADLGRLTIDSTGSATFSSSVTASGIINGTTSQFTAGGTAINTIYASGPSTFGVSSSDAIYLRRYGVGEYQFQTVSGGASGGNLSLQSYGGNVGIGTTTPQQLLDITSTSSPRIIITNLSNGGNAGLYFSTKNSSSVVQQGGVYYIPGSTPYLTLSGDNSGTHLNVTSTGNVGIGTTSPSYKLDVSGTGRFQHPDTPIRLDNNGGTFTQLDFLNNGTQKGAIWWNNSTSTLNLWTGVTSLTIASTGAATFSSSVKSTLFEASSAGTTKYHIGYYSGGLNFAETGIADFRLFIKDGGNVGIGTNNPGGTLHVAGGGSVIFGSTPNFNYKFNVQGFSGKYISFWTPTIQSVNNNGLMSHDGNGLTGLTPMGYNATIHVFNGEVTGGGTMQVNGDVNISGAFKINGTAIGTGGGGVSGSGTTNFLPRWTGSTSLGNSCVSYNGSQLILGDGTDYIGVSSSRSIQIKGTNDVILMGVYSPASGQGTPYSYMNRGKLFDTTNILSSATGLDISSGYLLNVDAGTDSGNTNIFTSNTTSYGSTLKTFAKIGTKYNWLACGWDGNTEMMLGAYSNTSGNGILSLGASRFGFGYYTTMYITWKTITLPNIPTSSSGLTTGDVWRDGSGYLRIV